MYASLMTGVGGKIQNNNCISSTRQNNSLRCKARMSSGGGNAFDALAHESTDWLLRLLTKTTRVQSVLHETSGARGDH